MSTDAGAETRGAAPPEPLAPELAAAPAGDGSGGDDAALPPIAARLAEAALLLSLPPLLGLWLHPADPFFTDDSARFLALPPLLLGLRRGALTGGLAALVLALLLYAGHRAGLPSLTPYPTALAAELLLIGLIPGEFADLWRRRLGALQRRAAYLDTRLQLFARAHHLLALSHEALEQRLLGEGQSLRDALLQLRRRAAEAPGAPLPAVADTILQLFGGFGWLHRAALYEAAPEGGLRPAPLTSLGAAPALPPERDPVVRRALAHGSLAVLDEEAAGADAAADRDGGARVAVPLVDLSGRVHGLLAVSELAFSAFTERHLTMLALLGGHVGDLLGGAAADLPAEFTRRLERCLDDARRYRVPSALVALVVDEARAPAGLAQELAGFHRSLDLAWPRRSRGGAAVILLLLPLLDEEGLAGFRRRLEARLRELGEGGGPAGPGAAAAVVLHERVLLGPGARPEALPALLEECDVAA